MSHSTRTKIALKATTTDRIITAIGGGIVLIIWCIIVVNYNSLPDSIPNHYNLSGNIIGYSSKATMWMHPIIASLIFALMLVINHRPNLLNLPVKVTDENALRVYSIGIRMFQYLSIIALILIGHMAYQTIYVTSTLPSWSLPISLALLVTVTIYLIIQLRHSRK